MTLDEVTQQVVWMREILDSLQTKVNAAQAGLIVQGLIDALDERITTLETTYTNLITRVTYLEDKINNAS